VVFVRILEGVGMPTNEGIIRTENPPIVLNEGVGASAVGWVEVDINEGVTDEMNSYLGHGVVQQPNVVRDNQIGLVTTLAHAINELG